MFADEGGVATVIRERRLDAAYRRIAGSSGAPGSMTSIAYAIGFSSGSQFLRAFRARFGVTPSEVRNDALLPDAWRTDHRLYVHFAGYARHGGRRTKTGRFP